MRDLPNPAAFLLTAVPHPRTPMKVGVRQGLRRRCRTRAEPEVRQFGTGVAAVLPAMQGRTTRTRLGRFACLLPKGQDRAVRLVALYALKTGSGNEKGSAGGCRFDCWAARGRFYRNGPHSHILQSYFRNCVLQMMERTKCTLIGLPLRPSS